MRRLLTSVLFCVILYVAAAAQHPTVEERPSPKSEAQIRLEREMARARNQDRFNNVKRDTDRLLALATELKQSVDRSNENLLSLDVVKKATEIEKLAKSVRDKMKAE